MVDILQSRTVRTGAAIGLALALAGGGAGSLVRAGESVKEILQFAAEMAKIGNWREARYRWELAAQRQPDNPRVLNNLAVALEALGQPEAARESYDKALRLGGGDRRIEDNRRRFELFWRPTETEDDGRLAAELETRRNRVSMDGKGKPLKITVELPVPARLDIEGVRTLLVASFLTDESTLLDINRELVRFLRSEFRKHAELEVLPVTPPPAVPEQTLEDLLANREFWKYLGREYGADLVVSGVVHYDRRDSSGFRDVDIVSPTTGQKVRRSQFVEQEKFQYELDIIFMDGNSGTLRFRDRLQRAAIYRGTQNDPITAFFDMSESIAEDVLAIVKARTREDIRIIFKS